MTTSTHAPAANAGNMRTPAIRTRLGSILAIAPLSVWVANHLYENLLIWRNDNGAAWQEDVTGYSTPISEILVLIAVVVPLLYHTAWGLVRMKATKPNLKSWPTFENLRFVLQRLAALGALLFIPAHLINARILPFIRQEHGSTHLTAPEFAHHMHNPATLIVYILGILGVTFHLANGLWGFAIHMGFYQGGNAQRRLRNTCIALFVILLGCGWGALAGMLIKYPS